MNLSGVLMTWNLPNHSVDWRTIRERTDIRSQTSIRIFPAIAAVVSPTKKVASRIGSKLSLWIGKRTATILSHPDFNGKITISRRSIDEWTNQPHIHYAEKNRMILYINDVLKQSVYLGHKQDCSTKPGNKWIHLFETKIQGDRSWIVVKEYQDGTKILYSISDSENILIGLMEK